MDARGVIVGGESAGGAVRRPERAEWFNTRVAPDTRKVLGFLV